MELLLHSSKCIEVLQHCQVNFPEVNPDICGEEQSMLTEVFAWVSMRIIFHIFNGSEETVIYI